MFQAIIALIRLLIDPQLRATLASARESTRSASEPWTKQLKRSRAKFAADKKHHVWAFADRLRDDLQKAQVSEKALFRFETVFAELVENAFRHGCRDRPRGKVTVICDYSRWFLLLRVADTGDGFPFEAYRSSPAYERHGLGITSRLTTQFEANPKGNVITALISSNDEITVQVKDDVDDESILSVSVSKQDLWHYAETSWEPLHETINASAKKLVLIDCRDVRWSTREARLGPTTVIAASESRGDHRFAFVMSQTALSLFDFTHLNLRNS